MVKKQNESESQTQAKEAATDTEIAEAVKTKVAELNSVLVEAASADIEVVLQQGTTREVGISADILFVIPKVKKVL